MTHLRVVRPSRNAGAFSRRVVFCKDCEHYRRPFVTRFGLHVERCSATLTIAKADPVRGFVSSPGDPRNLNAKLDCMMFSKKSERLPWWRRFLEWMKGWKKAK